nr:MAG TPA: Baseplate protein [Caudoviricetes sp.]
MVREFKLINEKGQSYSLMDAENACLLTEPSGLGYSYDTNYEQVGNTFIENLKKIEQGKITGTANFEKYDNYKKLVDFIDDAESLRFSYKIPFASKEKEYFKNVNFKEITKTQKAENGIISETITFECLGLWYEENTIEYTINPIENEIRWDFIWNTTFNDNNSQNLIYQNMGHVPAPITLEMNGAVSNPIIEIYIDDTLYQELRIKTTIAEYEKLIYNSKENEFAIKKIKTDGTEEELFDLNIIDFENDNVIRIPKNKTCEIRLKADNTVENAKLTIFPQYKSV